MSTFKISKSLNNNVLIANDENDKEVVLIGRGIGFGKNGEGYFRLTAFGNRERTIEAMQRLLNGFSS